MTTTTAGITTILEQEDTLPAQSAWVVASYPERKERKNRLDLCDLPARGSITPAPYLLLLLQHGLLVFELFLELFRQFGASLDRLQGRFHLHVLLSQGFAALLHQTNEPVKKRRRNLSLSRLQADVFIIQRTCACLHGTGQASVSNHREYVTLNRAGKVQENLAILWG